MSWIGSPLVGRNREFEAFQAALERSVEGAGSLLMLAGEAGIGKSFLANAFQSVAMQYDAVVVWGRCFEGSWQPPYGPWAEALRDSFLQYQSQRLPVEDSASIPYLARIVPELAEFFPPPQTVLPLSPDEERFRIFDAVCRWLVNIAKQRPLVMIFDDLHWADADSLLLLRYLARYVHQACLLIVGIYRSPDLDFEQNQDLLDVLALLSREPYFERLVLQGLTQAEIEAFIRKLANQSPPHELIQVIYELTEGNPFYINELFQHLMEEGRVLDPQGKWAVDVDTIRSGISLGIHEVLQFRLKRLSAETNQLLRFAAVLTGGFNFQLLQQLSGIPEEILLKCLDEAIASGLIRTTGEPAAQYDFVHAIVRHTLYEELNPDRRIRLHRQVAEVLEAMVEQPGGPFTGELAAQYHASRSLEQAERGIAYALAAAEEAHQGYAHQRRAHFLRIANDLAVSRPDEERVDILAKLAQAEADALMFDAAAATAQSAVGLMARTAISTQNIFALLARVARSLKEGGAPIAVWMPLVEDSLRFSGNRRDLNWARIALLHDRWEHMTSGGIHYDRWLGYDPDAVAILQREGDESDYAQTLEPFDWRSPEEIEQILSAARQWKTPAAYIRALNVAGRAALFYHAAFTQAESYGRELLLFSTKSGSLVGQAEALVLLAAARAARGKLALARRTARAAQDIVSRLGEAHRLHVVNEVALASVLAYYSDENWSHLVERSLELVMGATVNRWGMFGLYFPAFATIGMVREGQGEAARTLLEKIMPLFEQVDPFVTHLPMSVHAASSAVWELPAPEFAARLEHLALNVIEAKIGDSQIGSSELAVARMALLQGKTALSSEFFQRAKQQAEKNDQQAVLAIIDYDQALVELKHRGGDHSRAVALLAKAVEAFRGMEMAGWVDRANRVLETLRASAPTNDENSTALPDGLTPREAEVLGLIAQGLTNRAIADTLVLSTATVERHISNLYRKVGARGRADAVTYAHTRGLAGEN